MWPGKHLVSQECFPLWDVSIKTGKQTCLECFLSGYFSDNFNSPPKFHFMCGDTLTAANINRKKIQWPERRKLAILHQICPLNLCLICLVSANCHAVYTRAALQHACLLFNWEQYMSTDPYSNKSMFTCCNCVGIWRYFCRKSPFLS